MKSNGTKEYGEGTSGGFDSKARRRADKRKRKKIEKRNAAAAINTSTASLLDGAALESRTDGSSNIACSAHSNGSSPSVQAGDIRQLAGRKRARQTVATDTPKHPFPTEYGDHFETPLQAYRDVEGALSSLAKRLGKKRKHLKIWDPYYCAGRTPRLLAQLGFPRVEHRNEDFYKVIRDKQQPAHDVLVTNPPYSGDHKQRCLEYCRTSGKPWFLLIPNYVATKDYYKLAVLGSAAGEGGEPFYVVPNTKYPFDHPEGTGHADSPFFGVWFVHCGSHNDAVFEAAKAENKAGVAVVRSLEELAQRGTVKTERRLNPRQRKALKKKLGGGNGGVVSKRDVRPSSK